MVRLFGLLAFGVVLALLAASPTVAEEKKKDAAKEASLDGKITCPKCGLGTADKCGTVIVVKKGEKEEIYTFDAASNKKYHGDICKAGKDGKVTGTVKKDGDKMVISVTKLEYTK